MDDDKQLIGRILDGIRIYSPLDLKHISIKKQVSHILLAIPSASKKERIKIINKIKENKLNLIIKTLPSLLDIVQGKVFFQILKIWISRIYCKEFKLNQIILY